MTVNNGLFHASNPDMAKRLRRTELFISYVLRVGVIVSLLLIVSGSVISFIHHNEYLSSPSALQHLTQPGTAIFKSIQDIFKGLKVFRGQAVVTLGLLLLIMTPITRVLVSIFLFVYQGDRIFILITVLVFLILMLSFFLGKIG